MINFKYDLQLFGGGGQTTTQTRNIPDQGQGEATAQYYDTNYALNSMNSANSLLNQAKDISDAYGRGAYNTYNNNANNINSGYQNLLNGNLPSSYATNRQQALNSDLQGTVGSTINNLMSRGVLGDSSMTRSALNDISKNASDTLAKNYSNDLSNYGGLLGQSSANNASNFNNFQSYISNLNNGANSLANNNHNLFNTMYSGRMGTSGTSQSTSGGDNTAGLVGTLGSAAIMCFIAGTKVSTPSGDKNIEDIKLGDEVISIDGIQTVTYVQNPIISLDEYITVIDGENKVTTTSTQIFITPNGDVLATELEHVTAEVETVYDFSCTGSNTYYANGFLVRGAEHV